MIIWLTEHLPQDMLQILVLLYLVQNLLENVVYIYGLSNTRVKTSDDVRFWIIILLLMWFNPLTAGVVHIRFLHLLLAHFISAFKPAEDRKWHWSARFEICWPPLCYIWIIFTNLKLWIASARHNYKWLKIPIE